MRLTALAWVMGAAMIAPAAIAGGQAVDKTALARMLAGEVLSEDTRTDESGGAGRVMAHMNSPVRAVWDIVVSCEQAFRFVRGMRECEVLEDSGEYARIRQRVKQHWMTPAVEFVFTAERKPYERIVVELEGGDLKTLEASWTFEPVAQPGGIIVTHEIRIRPRIPSPRWLIRRSLRRDLPDMLACIRALALQQGGDEPVAADLERCLGRKKVGG